MIRNNLQELIANHAINKNNNPKNVNKQGSHCRQYQLKEYQISIQSIKVLKLGHIESSVDHVISRMRLSHGLLHILYKKKYISKEIYSKRNIS